MTRTNVRSRSLRAATLVSLGVLAAGTLAACNGDSDGDGALGNPFSEDPAESPSASATPQVKVSANVKRRQPVPVDRLVQVKAKFGGLRYYVDWPAGVTGEVIEQAESLIRAAEQACEALR